MDWPKFNSLLVVVCISVEFLSRLANLTLSASPTRGSAVSPIRVYPRHVLTFPRIYVADSFPQDGLASCVLGWVSRL